MWGRLENILPKKVKLNKEKEISCPKEELEDGLMEVHGILWNMNKIKDKDETPSVDKLCQRRRKGILQKVLKS